MAYDEHLADRIRQSLKNKKVSFEEKLMMGGWCAMVDDKMCVGIVKNDLMARIDPDQMDAFLAKSGVKPMDFTGKPLKGFIFVSPESIDLDDDLSEWIDVCLEYNPRARSSKKKK